MSDTFSSGSFPAIWINSREPLPETCITCGMFTDHRVKSKFVYSYQKTVPGGESGTKVALGCLLHLLGPIGWILATIMNGGEGEVEKTVSKKASIRVPCCRLCAGQRVPEAIDGTPQESRFLFEVHPRFADRLITLRKDAEDSR